MNTLVKQLFTHVVWVLLVLPLSLQAANIEESEHYIDLKEAVSTGAEGSVEVIELFSYACPHCYKFDPQVEHWLANKPDYIQFQRMPVVFRKSWKPLAKAYYALDQLDALEKGHTAIFNALHVKKKNIKTDEQMLEFLTETLAMPAEDIKKVYGSFVTGTKVSKGDNIARKVSVKYQKWGVPAMLVQGRYLVLGGLPGYQDGSVKIFDTVEFLAKKHHSAE